LTDSFSPASSAPAVAPDDPGSRPDIHHLLWADILRYFPAVILPRLTGIITVPIITRLFPPEIMGTYALVLANVAALGSAFISGISAALLRYLPEHEGDPEERNRLATTILGLACVLIIAVVISGWLVLALSGRLSRRFGFLMMFGLVMFGVTSLFNLLSMILRSQRKVGLFSTIQLLSGYGGLALGLMLVLGFNLGIHGLLIGNIAASLVGIGLAWHTAMRGRSIHPRFFSRPFARELARFAFFISLGNAAYWLLSLSDRWLLRIMKSAEDVGLYSVSYDITSKTTMLFVTAFGLALQPLSIASWEERGREATESFLASSTRTYLLVMLPASVGISLLASAIVGLLTGPGYQRGDVVVPFVAMAMFLYGLLDIAGRGLTLKKRPDLEARNFLVAGIVSVLLNLLFIPRLGIVGAAMVTTLGYLALLVMHAATVQGHVRWRVPWMTLLRTGLACAAMAAVVLPVRRILVDAPRGVDALAGALAGAATYGAAIVVLGEVSPRKAFRAIRAVFSSTS
jgi:O-antigen/teichoic acid export membrane protein